MSAAHTTAEGVVAAILTRCALLSRAVIVTIELEVGVSAAAVEALVAALRADLPAPLDIERVEVGEAGRARLAVLNTARDRLLQTLGALVLLSAEGEASRFLLAHTPDLTAHVDLALRFGPAPSALAGDALWAQLDAAQGARLGGLGLTGLVPNHADRVEIPLADVFVPPAALSASASEAPLILWVGEPGAGKSTALRAAALGLAALEGLEAPGAPPLRRLYVPLSAWSADGQRRAQRFGEWLGAFVGGQLGVPRVLFEGELSRCLLLLDGLDEVSTVGARRALLFELGQLVKEHPGLRVVVGAREQVLEQLLAEHRPLWRVERLGPLSKAQGDALVDRLLRAFHKLSAEAPLPPAVAERLAQAKAAGGLDELRGSPLLLTFFVVLMELNRAPPTHKTALYNAIVEMLIVSWQGVRGGGGARLNRAEALKALAPLGWGLVTRDAAGVSREALVAQLMANDRLSQSEVDRRAAAERRIEQLSEDSALLILKDGVYRFHHHTLAEFLAARAAMQTPALAQELANNPYDPRLEQTIAFAVSLAVDIEPRDELAALWLDALADKARRPGAYDAKIPSTLAVVLRDARGLPPSRRAALLEHSYRVTFHQKLSPWQRMIAVNRWRLSVADDWSEALGERLAGDARARAAIGAQLRVGLFWSPLDLVKWGVAPRWVYDWLISDDADERLTGWMFLVMVRCISAGQIDEWDPEAWAMFEATQVPLIEFAVSPELASELDAVICSAIEERRRRGASGAVVQP